MFKINYLQKSIKVPTIVIIGTCPSFPYTYQKFRIQQQLLEKTNTLISRQGSHWVTFHEICVEPFNSIMSREGILERCEESSFVTQFQVPFEWSYQTVPEFHRFEFFFNFSILLVSIHRKNDFSLEDIGSVNVIGLFVIYMSPLTHLRCTISQS